MPFLSERLNGEPLEAPLLQAIIGSPFHEQLVARLDSVIVGAATMKLLMGPGIKQEVYLEDFVVDKPIRGHGIGSSIWEEMLSWRKEQGVNLSFTSNPKRASAHKFYLNHGAVIRLTSVFHVSLQQ